MQKSNFPYAGFNIKDTKEYAYMFASPGPIYEPGEKGDFGICQVVYMQQVKKR